MNVLFLIPGLNLLDIISRLRDIDDENLQIQCDVFCDEKLEDEEELAVLKQVDGIDLNSHTDVFNAIIEKASSK